MVRWEFLPVCHVQPSPGGRAFTWGAWLEAALLVRASVAAWEHADEAWLHRAVRLDPAGAPAGDLLPFDPGRHARVPGEPPNGGRSERPIALDEAMARAWIAGILAAWRPVVHHHAELGVVSRLDEPGDGFRKRCLAPLRPVLLSGGVAMAAAAGRLGELTRGIATVRLGPEQLELRCARVAVVWYPEGAAPGCAGADPMVAGKARARR